MEREKAHRSEKGLDDRERGLHEQAEQLKTALGVAHVQVRIGNQPRKRGARGLAHKGDIFIDAETWAAGDAQARRVLAHELIHQAQGQLPPRSQLHEPSHAEAEANELAERYAANGEIERPRIPLDVETEERADTGFAQDIDPGVRAMIFIREFATPIAVHLGGWNSIAVLGREPNLVEPPLLSVWARKFMGQVFEHIFPDGKDPWTQLTRILGESTVVNMVARGRDEKTYFGEYNNRFTVPEWDHFADDLRSRITGLAAESLQRLAPRYAVLRTAKAIRVARARNLRGWPEEQDIPQVDAAQLAAGRPIDHAVIAALCEPALYARHAWVKDYGKVREAFPDLELDAATAGNQLRPVKLVFEAEEGLHNWLTVTEPAEATREEVANELYGDSADAHLLIEAGRRFGFPSPSSTALRDKYQREWEAKRSRAPKTDAATEAQLGTNAEVAYVGERDTARELMSDPVMAEAAIRAQSENITVNEPGKALGVLQRYSFIISDLTLCDVKVGQLPGPFVGVAAVLARAKQRADKIKGGDQQLATTYDISSSVQHEVTTAALSSLTSLAQGYTKLADGFKNSKDLSGYMEMSRPYRTVTAAFVDAISASELPETGRERLAAAQLAAREMPIDLMEAMLSNARQMIMAGRANLNDPNAQFLNTQSYDYGLGDMETTEAWVREQLRKAREVVTVDPGQLGQILADVQERISELQVNATILLSVQECHLLVHELEQHHAGWFDPTWKTSSLMDEEAIVEGWRRKWDHVWDLFLAAKYAAPENKKAANDALEKAFKGLANDEDWKKLHEQVGRKLAKEEKYARWVRIGILIGIAIATMGAGALAEGVAAGFELGTLGTGLFVAGAESLTTTVLGQLLVDDPSLKGFFVQLGENFVTFSIFRAASAGYRAVAGASKLALGGEIVGFQLEETVRTVWAANEEHKKKFGKPLSSDEMWDVAKDGIIVAGATFLAGAAGQKHLEALRVRGEDMGQAWIGKRIDHIESIDTSTVQFALVAQQSKKPADLQKALDSQRQSMEWQQKFYEDLLEHDGKRAREAGIDPDTLKDKPAEIAAQLRDNQIAGDMLKLDPVGPGEYMYPAKELPGFLDRQKQDPQVKAQVEDIESDPYTGAKRYRVSPEGGKPFVVTEKLPGMGRVIGGLADKATEPTTGVPDYSDKPMFSAAMIEKHSHIRVGFSLDNQGEALDVLRGLAEGNEAAYRRIGLDPPDLERFKPMEVEWGLGRRGKEYILIRGDFESVDWADFPDVEALSHTHPFRAGKGLKGLDEGGKIPFDSLLPDGSGFNPAKFHNQLVVFPSAADVVFAGVRGIDGHVVHTPYRITIVDGKPMLSNPTADGAGTPLSFVIGKPEHVGYYNNDHDIPIYRAKLSAEAAGLNRDFYAANHPDIGSLTWFSPPEMEAVTPGAPAPEAGPVTSAGDRFEPKTEVDRQAATAWEDLKTGSHELHGAKMKFQDDFLPMYREGWRFDPEAGWKKPGSAEKPRELPVGVSENDALQRLQHDPFIEMLMREHVVEKADMLSELRAIGPGGRLEAAVASQLKQRLGGKVVDHVLALPEEQRLPAFEALAKHLAADDRDALASELYRRDYVHSDAVTVTRNDNKALALAGDRTIDAIAEHHAGDEFVESTAIKVIGGDETLSPRQVQEARDFRRMVGEEVATSSDTTRIDRLRYVFISERGARKNLAFIEAMLDGGTNAIEIEVVDAAGKRHRIHDKSQLDRAELSWLKAESQHSSYRSEELRMMRELADGDIADAARAQTASGKDFDPKYRIEITATDYKLSDPAERQRFATNVIDRAQKHAAVHPDRGRSAIYLDLRGQDLEPGVVERLRMRIVDGSSGVIHDGDVVMIEGKIDAAANTSRFAELAKRAVDKGADAAAVDRLIKVLKARGLSGSIVAHWHENPLRYLSDPEVVGQLERVQDLADAGRIRNLSAWLEFTAPKADPFERAAELREAARRADEHPDLVIDIGGDSLAPVVGGATAPSFDGAEVGSNEVVSSFEVTTVKEPVRTGNDIAQGIRHATTKLKERSAVGSPIRGASKEVTIQIELAKTWKQGRNGTVFIASDGARVRRATDGREVEMTNIFEELTTLITKQPDHALLDRIIVVDTSGVKAVYERKGASWTLKK